MTYTLNHLIVHLLCVFVYFSCAAEKPRTYKLVVNGKYSIYPSESVRWKEAVNSCRPKFTKTDKKRDHVKTSEKSLINSNELAWRQKIVKSYLKDFSEIKKAWIEAENLNYISTELENSNEFLKIPNYHVLLNPIDNNDNHKPSNDVTSRKIESNFELSKSEKFSKLTPVPNCINDRVYIVRWFKKLLNKLKSSPYLQQNFIGFTFTDDLLENLERISASVNFDIESIDELISIAISNSTSDYNAYNYNNVWFNIDISSTYVLIPLGAIIFIVIMYIFYKIQMPPFYIICTLIIGSVIWHGYKMYLEGVARRHAILSSVPSSVCEVTLTKESGIFDYIKEYVKNYYYKEDCKKYYESLMVDPFTEINVLSVLADFSSSVFFRLFYPCAKAINFFIKETFFDMSFTERIITLILLISVLLFYFRYRIKFPFWLGSLEPMPVPIGSRVEDLHLPDKKGTLKVLLTNFCDSAASVKNTDVCISDIGTEKNISLERKETLPFIYSKQETSTKGISQKFLKFCKVCNETLLTNLDYTGNERTENYVFEDDTKQGDLIPDNSECQYCSINLQTILCENVIFEQKNIPLKIAVEPCVHLKYICCDCTKSMQCLVSGNNLTPKMTLNIL